LQLLEFWTKDQVGFDGSLRYVRGVEQIISSFLVNTGLQIMIDYNMIEGQKRATQDDWYTEIQGYDSLTRSRRPDLVRRTNRQFSILFEDEFLLLIATHCHYYCFRFWKVATNETNTLGKIQANQNCVTTMID